MQTVIGFRGVLILFLIYGAIGLPEIKACMAGGGQIGSCAVTGVMLGGLKLAFYFLGALVTGIFHVFF
jgi:hypothetical protein